MEAQLSKKQTDGRPMEWQPKLQETEHMRRAAGLGPERTALHSASYWPEDNAFLFHGFCT